MNGLALAEQHRVDQVRLSQLVMALLGEVWGQTMRPADLDGSFQTFLAAASVVIAQGRARSGDLARQYYDELAALVGYPTVPVATPAVDALRLAQLEVTGPVRVKQGLLRGLPMSLAMQRAQIASLGVAKRLVLDGGRETLIAASHKDPKVARWARVSDGSPCAFCAMLISRDSVYSSRASALQSHDHCGCGVRLVYPEDSDDGVSAQADKYGELWKAMDKDPRKFTSAMRLARGDIETSRLLDDDNLAALQKFQAEGVKF